MQLIILFFIWFCIYKIFTCLYEIIFSEVYVVHDRKKVRLRDTEFNSSLIMHIKKANIIEKLKLEDIKLFNYDDLHREIIFRNSVTLELILHCEF